MQDDYDGAIYHVQEVDDSFEGAIYHVKYVDGGPGDQHNLGYYATQAALEEAHPTAEAGDWAIVGATDTVWIWDTDNSAWVDSDQKGQVTPEMIIVKSATMPTASTVQGGAVYQYTGTTNATYTHGYIYENVATTTSSSASASQTVGSTLSDIAVDVETLETFTGWTTDNSLQIFYTDDGWSVDTTSLGVTYTGTPSVGDAITISYTAAVTSYAWTRIDVQPAPSGLPDQTGQSGKFLTTDGTDASWSDKPLVNNTNKPTSLGVIGRADAITSVAIGVDARAYNLNNGSKSVAIGNSAETNNIGQVAIGYCAIPHTAIGGIAIGMEATIDNVKHGAMQFGKGTNSESGTVCFGLTTDGTNYTNYKLLSADGTIPTARLTNAINKYSSMPTASADYLGQIVQFTGTTDATYTHGYIYECVSDGGNPATYSWTAVSVQAGGGSSLPSQTGNAGKFLTTDGTDASWSDKPLVNTATGSRSLTILGNATTASSGINIGADSRAATNGSIAIGDYAQVQNGNSAISIGNSSQAKGSAAVALGVYAYAYAANSIQLGHGQNNESDTLCFGCYYNNNWVNYKLLDSDGTIPTARLTKVNSTITLTAAGWSSNTQTVSVTGMTATGVVFVNPDPTDQADYTSAGILCTAQAAGTLTFTCDTTPSNDIDVVVVML